MTRRRRGGAATPTPTAAAAEGGAGKKKTPRDGNVPSPADARRGRRKGDDKSMGADADDAAPEGEQEQVEDDETLWQTFVRHPVVRITTVVLLPYALYHSYLHVVLQRPDLLLPLGVHLRPAVSPKDERQFLIVGSMSSGTTQMASELRSAFRGLEVGHETSNAQWDFVRDGTVSWFHAVRFFEDPKDEKESMEKRLKLAVAICGDGKQSRGHYSDLQVMGYHPSMYREPKMKCSYRRSAGDACWVADCYRKLVEEYGCSYRKDCETPFRFALHQVRNPLRTIESLSARFCPQGQSGSTARDDVGAGDNGGDGGSGGGGGDEIDWGGGGADEGETNRFRSFLIFANALFPAHDFAGDTCLGAVAEYVVLYNRVLLAARERGLVDAMYRIEEATACDVAKLAGLTDEETVVYGPNHEVVAAVCGGGGGGPHERIPKEKNPINKGTVRLGWSDLRSASSSDDGDGGGTLEDGVKQLFRDLGYDPALEEEVVTRDSSDSLPPPPRHEAKVAGQGEM